VRVELIDVQADAFVDFAATDVSALKVDLLRAERKGPGKDGPIDFALSVAL